MASSSSSSCVPASSAAVEKLSAASALRHHSRLSFPLPSKPKKPLLRIKGSRLSRNRSSIAKAQLSEVSGGSSSDADAAASAKIKPKVPPSKGVDSESNEEYIPSSSMSEEEMSEFMVQVASLVKLVDSKDIVELQLKQLNCELVIRKKEALPQPLAPAPANMMYPNSPPAAMGAPFQQHPAAAPLPSPAGASAAPSPPPSAPKLVKSSQPPLKSPMAGTFYRNPGPGLPPFVKPGDKVNKGQVLCIIEAMKLMNEIESDQAGTVVEILVDDGKPVGVDQPLFIIEP